MLGHVHEGILECALCAALTRLPRHGWILAASDEVEVVEGVTRDDQSTGYGLAAACARGHIGGGPTVIPPDLLDAARVSGRALRVGRAACVPRDEDLGGTRR